ncbi:hypothetical protein EVJ58_g8656 [Rhodofomes roseus]|uniref:Uncharacterized protein n=1 Tax=Rhodofomes roseus TaxID=34475 RepID=A0A4Y9Y068_9APHY|nr:hypothetical protein EVJ58_g8656 [Rhodofomes roseus]
MSNSWAPNETASEIYLDKIWLQSNILENIPYGVELTLFFMCFMALLQNMDRYNFKRQIFLLVFITIIFGLGTVFMITNSLLTQQAFIENRNFPGGPGAYLNAMFSDTVGLTSSVSWVVWRFLVFYSEFRKSWLVAPLLAAPCIMVMASITIGIVVLKDMANFNDSADSTPFVVANLTLSYYVISLAANILVSLLIAGRLLVYRRRILAVLGVPHASLYANIATIVVESAVLYSAFAITFLVTFGLGVEVADFFLNYVNSIQAICSYLIIYRVAKGQAWTEETSTKMKNKEEKGFRIGTTASIHFAHNSSADVTDSTLTSSKHTEGFMV